LVSINAIITIFVNVLISYKRYDILRFKDEGMLLCYEVSELTAVDFWLINVQLPSLNYHQIVIFLSEFKGVIHPS
jgi:hypothetical protein